MGISEDVASAHLAATCDDCTRVRSWQSGGLRLGEATGMCTGPKHMLKHQGIAPKASRSPTRSQWGRAGGRLG